MENIDQNLLTYFIYKKSIELDPDKYGNLQSIEEWGDTIKSNQQDIDLILSQAKELTDADWDNLNAEYMKLQDKSEQEQIQYAAKGARLKYLKAQEGMKFINDKLKNNRDYLLQREWDSTFHANHGIKYDLKQIINSGVFTTPDQIRSAENFGYIGTGKEAMERVNRNFERLYDTPVGAGSYDGKVAATDAYMKGNKMQLSNQDVVKLAEQIRANGGKTKWTNNGESYDLEKFLNKLDIDRVMRELARQNNPMKTINMVKSQAKGGQMKKKKKCNCGCDMLVSKAAGGKITEVCACKCGGKMKKPKK